MYRLPRSFPFFFFNDTATTEIYTLSLHDALPIWTLDSIDLCTGTPILLASESVTAQPGWSQDRKSTRLNSSHSQISYAVFCLKKKKNPANTDLDLDHTAPRPHPLH